MVVILSVYFYLYTRVIAQKDDKKIWVPPKPKQTLPFGLGPAPEPVKPEDYEETTYKQHEIGLVRQAVMSIFTSCAISAFMSWKFNVHLSFLINSVMMPINVYDLVVFKKYVLGVKKTETGGLLYDELFKAPTEETLKIAAKVAAAKLAQRESETASTNNAIAADEPRVVELTDEDEVKEKTEKKEQKTSGTDID